MKIKNKKGDGLASVIITIVLVVIALLIVPVFKAFQSSSGNDLRKEANATETIVDQAVTISGQEGYDKIA